MYSSNLNRQFDCIFFNTHNPVNNWIFLTYLFCRGILFYIINNPVNNLDIFYLLFFEKSKNNKKLVIIKMALKALLIAIRYFDTDCQLDGCHQDADDIAAYLHTTHFTSIHTVVMKDQQDDNTFQQPLCPTLENMITQMKLLIASAVPGDTLLVTYSGHGSNMRDTSGDEKDGRDECLCPVEIGR